MKLRDINLYDGRRGMHVPETMKFLKWHTVSPSFRKSLAVSIPAWNLLGHGITVTIFQKASVTKIKTDKIVYLSWSL